MAKHSNNESTSTPWHFWSFCRCRGPTSKSWHMNMNKNVYFAFLAGAVLALIISTMTNLYLYSSAVTSTFWTSRVNPKKQVSSIQAAASVDFIGDIVTKLDDDNETCLVEQQQQQTAVICAIAKYEEQYLDEWVDYHLALGFAHVFIYDNTPDFELQHWAKTKSCHVSVHHFPGSNPQAMAYLNCARNLRVHLNHTTWIAFFDIDEFLIIIDPKYQNNSTSNKQKHEDDNTQSLSVSGEDSGNGSNGSGGNVVVSFLQDYCPPGVALGINWKIMGTAGHTLYQPAPVTMRFQYATTPMNVTNMHVKSIIRHEDLNLDKVSHVHYPRFNKKPQYIIENNVNNTNTTTTMTRQQQRDTSGRVFSGPFNPNGPSNVALFYHYVYKSSNEYRTKRLVRGRADSKDPVPIHLVEEARQGRAQHGSYWDDTAWKAVKRHLLHYAVFDQLFPHYSIPPPALHQESS